MKAKKFLKKKGLKPDTIVSNTIQTGNSGEMYGYFLTDLLKEYAELKKK